MPIFLQPTRMRAQQKKRNNRFEGGFTLFEIMIVMAIIAAVIAIATPKLTSATTKAQTAVRHVAVLCRHLHDLARLKQQNYRLAIKMNREENVSEYWVESGPLNAVPLTEEQLKNMESMMEEERGAIMKRIAFTEDKSVMKKHTVLPKPISFLRVEFADRKDPILEGTTYVYFFGQGLSQEAAIHVGSEKDKLHWTLAIQPLTGHADMFQNDVKLADLKEQQK